MRGRDWGFPPNGISNLLGSRFPQEHLPYCLQLQLLLLLLLLLLFTVFCLPLTVDC